MTGVDRRPVETINVTGWGVGHWGESSVNTLYAWARASTLALAILLMGSVFVPSPAAAHQGDITAVAECRPNGTYLVTYTLSWSSVPEAAYGTRLLTREDTDGSFDSGWESDPGAYRWTDRGAITSTEGSISWTDTLPGTTLGAGRWEYGWLDWTNGNTRNRFHDTRVEDLGGDCADTTEPEPEPVSVNAEFGDNVCVDHVYTEPSLDAPEYDGTTREITGEVAPGSTVTVTYTALADHVIEGPSTFTHDYPATPASQADCDRLNPPEPVVRDRSTTRTDCTGVETREWQIVREYVWQDGEWVLDEPEIRNDTGWVMVRALTAQERQQLGCTEVKGEQQTSPPQGGSQVEVAPTQQSAPVQPSVPVAVDAGVAHATPGSLASAAAPAGQGWLFPLLGGVLVLGIAAFTRLKALGALV